MSGIDQSFLTMGKKGGEEKEKERKEEKEKEGENEH